MLVTVVLWFAAFILALGVPWPVFLVTGIVDGFVATPVFVYVAVQYAPQMLREKVGRLNYLYAAVLAGSLVFVQSGDGYLAGIPGENDEGESILQLETGDTVPFDPSRTMWYRLANRRLGFTWLRSDDVLREYAVDESLTVRDEDDEFAVFDRVRQGTPAASTAPDLATAQTNSGVVADGGETDGVLLDGVKVQSEIRGGGSTRQTDEAETKAMKEEGGEGALEAKTKMVGALATIAMASVVGVLIFGVLA